VQPETRADGTRVLRDAGGAASPLVRYARIASATIIADRVLADLCEPTRVVAVTDYGADRSVSAHRFAGKGRLAARASLESVLSLKPDLVLVNNLVDPGYVARLREHGIEVFDLGHMRGVDTLLPNIRAIGWLIGAPERAEAYAQALAERLARIAPDARTPRPRAIYVSMYGDKLFGGADRTSYHDVIRFAGLADAAAEAGLSGWPELSAERLLVLDPDIILTKPGMGQVMCRHGGLSALRACRGEARIVELDGALLDDPGPPILDAAETLYRALHGAAVAPAGASDGG